MIAYLSGIVFAKNLKDIIISTSAGVGYRVYLPLSDIHQIGPQNSTLSLYIHTHVKEDALDLYGFLQVQSLKLFEQLIQVSGVGPKLALAMLSGMEITHLQQALELGDHQKLTQIPGIGPKMAQRITLELKGKIAPTILDSDSSNRHTFHDLRLAMTNLGYKQQAVEKAVQSIEKEHIQKMPADLSLSQLIKQTLQLLQQGN